MCEFSSRFLVFSVFSLAVGPTFEKQTSLDYVALCQYALKIKLLIIILILANFLSHKLYISPYAALVTRNSSNDIFSSVVRNAGLLYGYVLSS